MTNEEAIRILTNVVATLAKDVSQFVKRLEQLEKSAATGGEIRKRAPDRTRESLRVAGDDAQSGLTANRRRVALG